MIDNIDGWIPAPDAIARDCGPIAACIWGVVWAYSQPQTGFLAQPRKGVVGFEPKGCTVTDNTDNYTPISLTILRELGTAAAYVWGAVWRLADPKTGVCCASHATIAERAFVCRRTVIRQLRRLIEAGYLRDLTPGAASRPHAYTLTDRLPVPALTRPPGPPR